MSKHSRISSSVSPLLWLAPLPFVLAMCLPLELPRADAGRHDVEHVATVPGKAQVMADAASAAMP
jgi:hypothetical protein